MKKIVQMLTEIINPDAAIAKSQLLRINEPANENDNSKCQYIEFKQMKGQYFAFKLDDPEIGRISNYLNPSKGEINRGCDAVIYIKINNRKYVLFIELKSHSQSGIKKAKKQFVNSELFIDYINTLIRKYGKLNTDDIEKRYFIFCTRPNASKPTDNNKKIQPRTEEGRKIYLCRCNQTVYLKSFDLS